MSSTRKKPDAFQIELNEAMMTRRHKQGRNTPLIEETDTEDDDDDYSDEDFDDDDSLSNEFAIQSRMDKSSKKNYFDRTSPSYLKEEDDSDLFLGNSAKFLKGDKGKKSFMKPTHDSFRTAKFDEPFKGVSSNDDDEFVHDSDPILNLLREPGKSNKPPTPAKRGREKQNITDYVKYPQQRMASPNYVERAKSPIGASVTPTRRKTPEKGHRSPVHSPEHSLDKTMRRSPEDLRAGKSRGLERQQRFREDSGPKPVGSGKSSPISGILESMKKSTSEDIFSAHPPTKAMSLESEKEKSYTDFLLGPDQPKPVPRKKGTKSPSTDSFKSTRKSLSPTNSREMMGKDPQKKQKSSDSLKQPKSPSVEIQERSESPIHRQISARSDKTSFPSLSFPSLQSKPLTGTDVMNHNNPALPTASSQETKSEKAKSNADADDLLALFNQATSGEGVDFEAHRQQQQFETKADGRKTPVEEVLQRTTDQQTHGEPKQRLSRQVMDNAIDVVAEHNVNPDMGSTKKPDEKMKKSTRSKSGKSYRTPPSNYQGLGSLTMLDELKKGTGGKEEQTITSSVTTDDIRKRVYLEWLARREKEAKKKRREEAQRNKEKEEKEQKEREEKEAENLLVRKKWDEIKKEKLKEKEKEKRKQEKLKQEAQEKKEKQKLKSQKDAERRRELMIENAKREHQAEQKKKRQEENRRKKAEEDQKKENEKALDKWMNNRSEKWVSDRKTEQKQKQKQEKKAEKEKEKSVKIAEEKYNTWREHKDNELKTSIRESKLKQRQTFHIEEDEENYQPPWNPPSRVIPRRR